MSGVRWAYSGEPAALEDVQACVGDGWADLVKYAYRILEQQDEPLIYQVKEKFGGLRFYHSPVCEEIEEVCAISTEICEKCGMPGEPRPTRPGSYWVKTLCNSCVESEEER